MIISDKHRFVFIHIPKCAGTFVRSTVEPFDDTGGRFSNHVGEHPQLGLVDYVHLPLKVLKEYFPSEFERVVDYDAFAILRDPFARFPSALAQRLRMYKRVALNSLSEVEIEREVDEVIDYLTQQQGLLRHDFIHFERQVNYVQLEGELVVRRLYAVNQVNDLLDDIGRLVGHDICEQGGGAAVQNLTYMYRNQAMAGLFRRLIPAVPAGIRAMLPSAGKEFIRRMVYVPRSQKEPKVFLSQHVQDFVRSYYAADFELLSSLGLASDPCRSGR